MEVACVGAERAGEPRDLRLVRSPHSTGHSYNHDSYEQQLRHKMGLVDYSDSEGSDAEPVPAAAPKSAPAKPTFQKKIDRSEPKKIKVDLPTIKPEPGQQDEEPRPAKRARTSGAFSGFNSMLPAPKGRVQSGPKPGVSLKTSSEAAFSRTTVDSERGAETAGGEDRALLGAGPSTEKAAVEQEPKIVGKTTKFKPLSVANNKKKPTKRPKLQESVGMNGSSSNGAVPSKPAAATEPPPEPVAAPQEPAPKPKRSLFSVQNDESGDLPAPNDATSYQSILETASSHSRDPDHQPPGQPPANPPPSSNSNPNTLSSLATDLNLTPAQRRQLFGRGTANAKDANIAHFNMDSEYAANEQARQTGEVVEHRAVKAIAPGKHSLQQLVNNARTQQGGLEDKWAEGRRERGEAGGKYGWGK